MYRTCEEGAPTRGIKFWRELNSAMLEYVHLHVYIGCRQTDTCMYQHLKKDLIYLVPIEKTLVQLADTCIWLLVIIHGIVITHSRYAMLLWKKLCIATPPHQTPLPQFCNLSLQVEFILVLRLYIAIMLSLLLGIIAWY